MCTQLFYILDERKSLKELKNDILVSKPITFDEVVDIVIARAKAKCDAHFKTFQKKYESHSYKYYSLDQKRVIFHNDLKDIENAFITYGSWNDSKLVMQDLKNALWIHKNIDNYCVFYEYYLEIFVELAIKLLTVKKKNEFLSERLDSIDAKLNQEKTGSSNFNDSDCIKLDITNILMEYFPGYTNLNHLNHIKDELSGKLDEKASFPPIEVVCAQKRIWEALGKILDNTDYNYRHIAKTINKNIIWKKNNASIGKFLPEATIKSNMYKYSIRKKKHRF